MDTQDTARRFPGARILGQHGGFAFVEVHAVLAVAGDAVRFHGPAEAWDGSPEAQAIALDQAIEAQRQELERLLRERGEVHALGDIRGAPALPAPEAEAAAPVKKKRRFKRHRCLGCGEVCGNLGTHGKYNHPGVPIEQLRGAEVTDDAPEPPAPEGMAPGAAARAAEPPAAPEQGTETPPRLRRPLRGLERSGAQNDRRNRGAPGRDRLAGAERADAGRD
ncbi:MAG: hypothetical protein HGA45_21535 [Chloroflexales bacterium]|nr:hypothetical protein [Chloroflexales bacterium]